MKLRCNLSTLMGSRRYSIQDVHKMTGLSRGTISSLYNDRASRIDYETITKLCELFGCEVGTLLTFEKKELKGKNKFGGRQWAIQMRKVIHLK